MKFAQKLKKNQNVIVTSKFIKILQDETPQGFFEDHGLG